MFGFGLLHGMGFAGVLTEIGLHFHRDRTTVSHACAMVEDKRDEMEFDVLLTQLESLLIEARNAMALSLGELLQHAHGTTAAASSLEPESAPPFFETQHRRSA